MNISYMKDNVVPLVRIEIKENKNLRWGFNGVVADDEVRNCYLNKSISKYKKKGALPPPFKFKI